MDAGQGRAASRRTGHAAARRLDPAPAALAILKPTRFYYVHRIDRAATPPQRKDQAWHHMRLDWQGAAGRIQIFVDGSTTAAFDVTDGTMASGRVGLGSFDDTGEFRGIELIGNR